MITIAPEIQRRIAEAAITWRIEEKLYDVYQANGNYLAARTQRRVVAEARKEFDAAVEAAQQ